MTEKVYKLVSYIISCECGMPGEVNYKGTWYCVSCHNQKLADESRELRRQDAERLAEALDRIRKVQEGEG
jgi:hypothetical protein